MTKPEPVRLVPFTVEHFETLAGWFPDARALAQWGGTRLTFPLDAAQMRAMLALSSGERPDWLYFAAKQGDAVVGHCEILFDYLDGIARLCRIAIAPDCRGRGLARPMLTCLVDEALKDASIERVELNVYDFNETAIRAYQAFGFRMEGIRRSSARFLNERWDTCMMSLLRSEWESR
ncbi:GNAT family N-acetyltransferase [Martelella mediterranea]|uniref:GNAT family N-acetyltransferase n=1 Tax=Martelella mediterranea TaxID=293089 RepID=UPI001E455D54|nr:GNAT family protein [Martelella mediterranea]MCD1633608.1 GNAT family N-acetyltransferase [Martelella mediterranea]